MRKKTQKAKYMQVDNDTASYEKRSEIYNMRGYDSQKLISFATSII